MAHLWFYTVHWPMQAPEELLKKYAGRKGPGLNDTRYGAMIEGMDLAIGRLLSALKKMGLEEDTLVIFTSDNGGFAGVSDCRPLRESKGYLYEGGIRVPLIVSWPGQVPKGKLCKTPVISMDFYPTFLELAALKPCGKPIDGESLLPLQAKWKTIPPNNFPFPQLCMAHGKQVGWCSTKRKVENDPQLR